MMEPNRVDSALAIKTLEDQAASEINFGNIISVTIHH